MEDRPKRLLDRLREAIRLKHYSPHTQEDKAGGFTPQPPGRRLAWPRCPKPALQTAVGVG